MIKIMMSGCNEDKLLTALSMIDDSTMNKVMAIASGDVQIYDSFSLPKPNRESILKLILTNFRYVSEMEDIVHIKEVSIENFCSEVRIHFTYKRYRWYVDEEALQKDSDYNTYKTPKYVVRGKAIDDNNTDSISIPIDKWLDYVKEHAND